MASSSCVIKLSPSSIQLLSNSDANMHSVGDDGIRWMIIGKHLQHSPHILMAHETGNIHSHPSVLFLFVLVCLVYIHVHIGGSNGSNQLTSCISYVPSLNKLVDMPSLNVARYRSTISVWILEIKKPFISFTHSSIALSSFARFSSSTPKKKWPREHLYLSFNSNDMDTK
jgi:hypothetical protein